MIGIYRPQWRPSLGNLHQAHRQEHLRAVVLPQLMLAINVSLMARVDMDQLAASNTPWAWEFFLKGNRNHWTPLEINMAQDVHDYHHKLTALNGTFLRMFWRI